MPRAFFLSLIVAGCVAAQAFAAEQRFTAVLADGTRVTGPEVHPWHIAGAQPKLGDAFLLDPKNPVRWLRDNSLPLPAEPEAMVEYVGGDRLPGTVVSFSRGNDNPLEIEPPHLVVETPKNYDWPDARRDTLRAAARWLRRIVWQRRPGDRYEPGTAFCLDGRRIAFRSVRLQETSALLLLEEGTAEVPFTELAELHFPAQDAWECYFQQLAHIAPDGASRLARIETVDGLMATTSQERFQPLAHGSHDVDRWYHLIQPAWSLEPLWVRHRDVQFRRFSDPHVVPLTQIDPVADNGRPAAGAPAATLASGGHWRWRWDQNVQGDVLTAADGSQGWGIGTHAPAKITWQLPEIARGFRVRVGLDALAGQGGCAKARVIVGDALIAWESHYLVGSQQAVDTGLLDLAKSPAGKRTVTLESDPAHEGRPAGADPLNIRDFVDWIEPEVVLNIDQLRAQIREHAAGEVAAWQGWTANPPQAIELANRYDATRPATPRYRSQVVPRLPFATLSREVRVPEGPSWLALCVSRFVEGTAPGKVQVRADGRVLATRDVPQRTGRSDPDALLFSLAGLAGREVRLDVTIVPMGPQALLDFRGFAIVDRPPGLMELVQDNSKTAAAFDEGEGFAETDDVSPYAGAAAIKFAAPGQWAPALPGLPVAISEHPRLGQFRYLRFAWRIEGGKRVCLELGHNGAFGPPEDRKTPRDSFRYDAGQGEASRGAALRLGGNPPSPWVEVTRDLYADFGEFELTGLGLALPEGATAWLDHVYLGRTLQDFEKIDVPKNSPPKKQPSRQK